MQGQQRIVHGFETSPIKVGFKTYKFPTEILVVRTYPNREFQVRYGLKTHFGGNVIAGYYLITKQKRHPMWLFKAEEETFNKAVKELWRKIHSKDVIDAIPTIIKIK